MNRSVFFAKLRDDRSLFRSGLMSSASVVGIEAILNAYTADGGTDIRHLAYILATAHHETGGRLEPIIEATLPSDARPISEATAISRLESSWARGRLTWVKTPYWRKDATGKSWLGRGFAQITHKSNYERAGRELGVDLVTDPSRALEPGIAAAILVRGSREGWFTGKRLADYIAGDQCDYVSARAVINGDVKGNGPKVAALAAAFEAAIKAATLPVVPPEQPSIEQRTGLAFGAIGEDVKRLQANLAALGIDPGPIDGKFGKKTESAVLIFQERYVPRRRGVVDAVTAAALVQAVAEVKKG